MSVAIDPAPAPSIKTSIYRKPSIAVRAAIHGLQTNRERPDFTLNMRTFGTLTELEPTHKNGVRQCFGCMATCALQSITNTSLRVGNISSPESRAIACDQSYWDVKSFEKAIDYLRVNNPNHLYTLCEVDHIPGLPSRVPVSRSFTTNNHEGYVLEGEPSNAEVDTAIERLTLFAEKLEKLGF